MEKQNKRILLNIDDKLKNQFLKKCEENHMKISARIKFLIKMDVNNKISFN